jgi:4-amino-4-deoxy-L-arabinose transferase-like glycosyltransferase
MHTPRITDRLGAAIVFAIVFLILFSLHGNRLMLGTGDEGIYLETGRHMLEGQKPYVDFFVIGAPGVYWVQEWAFRLLGINMPAGRIPVLLYLSIDCALLFWIAARLSSRRAAAVVVAFFVVFQTADPTVLTPQHRWDSNAITLLAIAIAIHAQCIKSRWWIAISGALFVLATIFTPSIAIAGIVTFLWLAARRATWPLLLPFTAGCTVMTGVLTAVLWNTGILFAFLGQMLWLSRNYSGVNVMPYGSIIGGYSALLAGKFSFEWALRTGIVLCIVLPAILPIASTLGWAAALWFDRKSSILQRNAPTVIYLLLCMVALIAASYPRADVAHLAFVAVVPYALTTALIFCYLPRSVWTVIFVILTCFGTVFCLNTASTLLAEKRIVTPIGRLRASPAAIPQVEALLKTVHPGDGLFVHPYKPLLYFLTLAKNPTRYSFLGPGMMTEQDAQSALQDLARNPPQWVLHLDLTPEDFLRVFPSGDPSIFEFKSIEQWIHSGYSELPPPGIAVDGYKLLKRSQ